MKTATRLLAIFCAGILMFGATACRSGDTSSAASVPSGGSDASETEKVSLDGYEIHIVAPWGGMEPTADGGTEMQRLQYQRFLDVQKDFNCKIVFDAVADLYSQFEASAMAGERLGDLVLMRGEYVYSYASQGLLYPIGDVVNLELEQFIRDNEEKCKIGDKVYAYSISRPAVEATIFFNKGLFSRLGLESPYDLMGRGEWTMENFAKLARDATRDTDGDGKIDTYGMPAVLVDPEVIYFIAAFGGTTVKTENGRFVSGLEDEKTTAALSFLRKMNVEDKSTLLPDDKPTWDWGIKQFMNGNCAMCQTNITNPGVAAKDTLSDGYGIVPMPLGPGQTEYQLISQSFLSYVMHSSMDAALADKIGAVMEAYTAPLVDEERVEEQRIQDWEQYVCDEESIETLRMLNKLPNPVFPYLGFGDAWYSSVQNQLYHCLVGNYTIATAMATCNPVFQAVLDRTNDRLAP